MSLDWRTTPLGEFVSLQRGHDLPDHARRPGTVPILGSFGVTGFHDVAKARGPGVTIGRSGASFGVAAYTDQDYWPLNTALYVTDFKGNDPKFVYYFLKLFDFSGFNSGSAQPSLNRNNIYPVPVRVPPPRAQAGIARFVSALDDRIALLRETNASLEAIAQALFKSWFVDFDPVRAKQQGLAPAGMDEATAALFPDKLVEATLGWIPLGWSVGKLEDLLVLQRGFDLPAQARVPGAYPIIAASGLSGTHIESMAKGPGVVTGRSGVLGRVFLELGDYWPLNTTLWVKEFRAVTPCYAYELLRMLDFKSFNAGSAVPTLNRNHVHGLPYVIPNRACVVAFERLALQLHQRSRLIEEQTQTLAVLRDTLLPRLISGQLRLPEAEALIEETA